MVPNRFGSETVVIFDGTLVVTMKDGGVLVFDNAGGAVLVGATDTTGGFGRMTGTCLGISTFFGW